MNHSREFTTCVPHSNETHTEHAAHGPVLHWFNMMLLYFRALIPRANEWLRQNPSIKIKVCESVESKRSSNQPMADTNTSSYYESGRHATIFLRSLRIWVVPKTAEDNPAPQQIGYLNVVPACISAGGFLSQPQFEPYSTTLAKLNEMLQQQPLPGMAVSHLDSI